MHKTNKSCVKYHNESKDEIDYIYSLCYARSSFINCTVLYMKTELGEPISRNQVSFYYYLLSISVIQFIERNSSMN